MIWPLLLALHLIHSWPGPDVEIEPPDAKAQQDAFDYARKMSGPPGCRGLFSGCDPWVFES